MPIEAYNNIGKVKRYYSPLYRVYEILNIKLLLTSKEVILQIVVKTVNDSVGPDNIVPTLFVFSAYLRITKESLLLLLVTKRAQVIHKAIKEIRRLYIKR
jgi:hypothetical protein